MKDKYFLDTNVLVYTFDSSNKTKQEKSQTLIGNALNGQYGIISFQVVQEFMNVATQKFAVPLTLPDCKAYLDHVLMPLCEVLPSQALYKHALEIKEDYKFSFYDSLIIAAAIAGDCNLLYTEDLQSNQKIHGTTIKNPFA